MKLYCLNGDPVYPCFVLTAKGCTVMLDCSLNMKPLQHFLPQMLVPAQRFENMPNFRTHTGVQIDSTKEFNSRVYLNSTLEFSAPQFDLINIEDLDAVLISNFNSMLALPYLTKLKEFRANIYVTEPIMHLGRILMEELCHFVKSNQMKEESEKLNIPKNSTIEDKENISTDSPPVKQKRPNESQESSGSSFSWKQYSTQLAQAFNIVEPHLKPSNWKLLYTKEDIDLCLTKMKLVDYDERISVFGSLVVHPKSSGYSLGSCNWTIEADCDSILYLSRSSLLNTHSKLFNQQFLKSQPLVDCLLLSGLNQAATHEPEAMVLDFCKACIVTIKNQGSVLIPTSPTGKIYDLIEILHRYLCDANMSNVPVYFISSFANQSLAYSNIFAEWLCDSKQSLAYAAEYPFQHGDLVKTNFLKVINQLFLKKSLEFELINLKI
jgi:integrator complex subunit 9